MGRIKRVEKSVSILMTVILLMITAPVPSGFAALIGTEAILVNQDTQNARDQLRSFLNREDVQFQLTARGIDPAEAKARIDSLSDAEVMQIADKIDQLPAGGSFWGTLLFVTIIAFVVLVVLELLGYTDFI
ncbi:MAG: PA2779 family protein [Desulfobacterales bacterium]